MADSMIGAQMYTLREFTKTPLEIAKSCRRLREIGYEAVQVSGIGAIETAELAKILRDEGLVCAATHVSLDMMKETNRCLDYHEALGCRYTAVGGFAGAMTATAQQWRQFADEYSAVARSLAPKGLAVGYHNHSHELSPLEEPRPAGPGSTILDMLLDRCDPAVWFEIDTYWIAHGGSDPAAWIDRLPNRIPCVHVKDMAISLQREQSMCEVGLGNLNWPRILESCRHAGVQWYLVERDSGDLDPFLSLQISLMNLKAMGVQ